MQMLFQFSCKIVLNIKVVINSTLPPQKKKKEEEEEQKAKQNIVKLKK